LREKLSLEVLAELSDWMREQAASLRREPVSLQQRLDALIDGLEQRAAAMNNLVELGARLAVYEALNAGFKDTDPPTSNPPS
jgi:hypothetical protein